MTQHAEGSYPAARIALIAAGLAAAFAVGFAISRSHGDDAATKAASQDTPAAVQSISTLEQQAKTNPKDAKVWEKLGLAYYDDSRFDDAARAYQKATELSSDDALLWSALGEARVMASAHDPMPDKAVAAFKRAITLDPKDPRARYFLAVKRDLGGDHEGAIADWLALLEETPQNAPWRDDLVHTVEQVGKINRINVASRLAQAGAKSPQPPPMPAAAQAIPGPSAGDLAAASQIPPGEQRKMAEGMVARLEGRLKDDPGNVDGWVMLIRSRVTLGQPDKAAQALEDAVEANPAQAAQIRQQAAILGVK